MKSPLFRISVAETEKAVYLLSDFHHLIFDGASVALFFEQLKRCTKGVILSLKATPTLIMQRMKLRLKAVMNLEMLKSSSTI